MPISYEDRILRVLTYVHDNPAGDLSLDQLADVAAMSRFHWHRVFRAMTGETCAQAVRRIRLQMAAVKLVQSDQSIDRISAQCGYDNVQSFSRAFSESYGQRPSLFRRAGRLLPPFSPTKPGGYPMYTVVTRDEPARRLVGLRHQGPYHQIGRSFEKFTAICESRSLWVWVGPIIGIYYDDPGAVSEDRLNAFAGAQWLGPDVPDGLTSAELPGGKTAVMTYKGPYSGLASAYQSLFGDWLPKSGHEPADTPCYEISLNSPHETAPEDLLTEICLPLK